MVAALLTVGAWLACFVAMVLMGWSYIHLTGAAFVALAAVLTYMSGCKNGVLGAFMAQAALAFSICGKGLLIFGLIVLWSLTSGQACGLVCLITVISYPVFTQKIDRALMVFASVSAFEWWVCQYRFFIWPYMETISVLLFVGAYILFLMQSKKVRPLAWGILPACASAFVLALAFRENFSMSFNSLLLGICLCGVYAWQVRDKFNLGVAVLILLLSYLTNTGTVMGVALLALAFGQNRLSLKIAGAAVFSLSLIWLYYHMETTLLVKSYYLWAVGVVLLILYAWQKRGTYAR